MNDALAIRCRTIGIIGYGSFGRLVHNLIRRFTLFVEVKVYEPGREEEFSSLQEVVACDAIIFSVPMKHFEEVLRHVLSMPELRPNTVLVEVCTDKAQPSSLLSKLAGGQPRIALHALFGPEAYRNSGGDVRGFQIVVVDQNLPEVLYVKLHRFVSSLGFEIFEMTAEQHDQQVVAEALYPIHVVAQILQLAGLMDPHTPSKRIAPPSFKDFERGVRSVMGDMGIMLTLYERVPACREVLDRIIEAALRLREIKQERVAK